MRNEPGLPTWTFAVMAVLSCFSCAGDDDTPEQERDGSIVDSGGTGGSSGSGTGGSSAEGGAGAGGMDASTDAGGDGAVDDAAPSDEDAGDGCDDNNACTTDSAGPNGTCVYAPAVLCPTGADACHEFPFCDSKTGACVSPPKPNGAACDDNNGCTQSDSCQSGMCTGSNPVTCTASDQCHEAGTCNPASGTCSNPVKADNAACDDNNECTHSDRCQGGVCLGVLGC